MSLGVKYTFPSDVYPRYSYLQGWTLKLLNRFKAKISKSRTTEKNHFEECVCQGYADLEDIISAGKVLSQPQIFVFAQDKSLVRSLTQDLVQTLEPFRHKKLAYQKIPWRDFVKEECSQNDFDSKILVVISKEGDNEMINKLSQLPEVQQRNTLVYDPDTKGHRLFHDNNDDYLPTKDVHPKRISSDIQSLLERKVVVLLQKIEAYIEPLVPREGVDPGLSLVDDVKNTIQHLEICCLKEITDDTPPLFKYIDIDNQGRCPKVLEKQKKRRKRRKKGRTHKVQDVKSNKEFKKRPPKTKWVDWFFEKRSLTMKEGKALLELIERRISCRMIEHLSAKYGIHPMVTTSLLTSDKFFNMEDKFSGWIRKERIDSLEMIGDVVNTCQAKITHLVLDVEKYILEKYEQLETIQRLQFELYGILRQTHYDVKIREIAKLDSNLQDELLKVEEVTGCGTIYGILTLHASADLSESSKEGIKELLRRYNYYKGYKVNVVSSKEQAGTAFIEIDNGTELQADPISEDGKKKFGTLGCFVDVAEKADMVYSRQQESVTRSPASHQRQTLSVEGSHAQSGASSNSDKDSATDKVSTEVNQQTNSDKTLHCITCRHCVSDCRPEIKTKHGTGVLADQTPYYIAQGDRFDIALLKMRQDEIYDCVVKMRTRIDDMAERRCPWDILHNTNKLASRPVFKYGSQSQFTCGVIASDDYKETQMAQEREKRESEGWSDPDHFLDGTVNVIIIGSDTNTETQDVNSQPNNSAQDPQQNTESINFSTDGDSGSVICDRNINNLRVTAISILHGALVRGDKWVCTYSALLKHTFTELENKFNIAITVPEFKEPDMMDNPFAAVENDLSFSLETMEISESEASSQRNRMETDGAGTDEADTPPADKMYYKPSGLFVSAEDHNLYTGTRQQTMRQCRSSSPNRHTNVS